MKTALYRHFDKDNQLLYVGVSVSVMRRLSEHNNSSSWAGLITYVSVDYFDSREEALAAEATAIKAENPKFNIQHKPPVRYDQNVVYLDDYRQKNSGIGSLTIEDRCWAAVDYILNHAWHFSQVELGMIGEGLMENSN